MVVQPGPNGVEFRAITPVCFKNLMMVENAILQFPVVARSR
jgi:hypothetical protein